MSSKYSFCPQRTVYVHRVQLMFPEYSLWSTFYPQSTVFQFQEYSLCPQSTVYVLKVQFLAPENSLCP